jgi:hypothetical protein
MSWDEAPNTVRVACSERNVLRLLMALLLTAADRLLLLAVLLLLLVLLMLPLPLLLTGGLTARPALLPCAVLALPAGLRAELLLLVAARNTCLLCRSSSEQMRLCSARIACWGGRVGARGRGGTGLCVVVLTVQCCVL